MDNGLLSQVAATALLPPFSLILLLGTGIVLRRSRPRLAMSVIAFSTVALYALSTPWLGGVLLKTLELRGPVQPDELRQVQAIVVLGGGRRIGSREYGGDTLNPISLERLRYAAHLARTTGLPLLVAGGRPGGGALTEGELMRRMLDAEYGQPPRWVETASRTTWENARRCAPLLRRDGVQRIALVTHAWHLRRAVPQFEAQGFAVTPAGLQFSSSRPGSVLDLLPSAAGLRDSAYATHEWLGILWYKLRSFFQPPHKGPA